MQRSSGRTTTWINGAPLYDESQPSRDAARVTVVPNVGEPGVSLKVGETYERANGAVSDVLNGGEITVGKSPSKVRSATAHGTAATSSSRTR